MTLGAPSSGVCLNLSSGPVYRTPSVTIHPAALFSILDHYLRRTDTPTARTRGEGDDAVSVRGAFAVLHSETSEQVAVDMDYHRAMFDLSQRVNPKESIVGWYSTGSNLNTYSALIQNFYSQETAPYPAIHIALNTGTEAGEEAGVKAYISTSSRKRAYIACGELAQLESTLKDVLDMLDRVLAYAQEQQPEKPADAALGRYLMDALGAGTEELGKGTSSLQDTLMMSYLANLVRAQAEVSARLALVTAP
ncbi:hypothetical protein B0F90DRAFT_1671480 [Multifurca ochricompacta]|uniref:MPN domain-containing protein n=1 Tax=Multifurca ochricompacta TaxID=376703 RepID=A0AAD4QJA8_9AGAM|nr:hypothetical protein B0F90DRAFT_1671480 [Multifurca ochricompacta]